MISLLHNRCRCDVLEDLLGSGSTQATTDTASVGNDQPFWDAVNKHIKNLHVVISGHGACRSSYDQAIC